MYHVFATIIQIYAIIAAVNMHYVLSRTDTLSGPPLQHPLGYKTKTQSYNSSTSHHITRHTTQKSGYECTHVNMHHPHNISDETSTPVDLCPHITKKKKRRYHCFRLQHQHFLRAALSRLTANCSSRCRGGSRGGLRSSNSSSSSRGCGSPAPALECLRVLLHGRNVRLRVH